MQRREGSPGTMQQVGSKERGGQLRIIDREEAWPVDSRSTGV